MQKKEVRLAQDHAARAVWDNNPPVASGRKRNRPASAVVTGEWNCPDCSYRGPYRSSGMCNACRNAYARAYHAVRKARLEEEKEAALPATRRVPAPVSAAPTSPGEQGAPVIAGTIPNEAEPEPDTEPGEEEDEPLLIMGPTEKVPPQAGPHPFAGAPSAGCPVARLEAAPAPPPPADYLAGVAIGYRMTDAERAALNAAIHAGTIEMGGGRFDIHAQGGGGQFYPVILRSIPSAGCRAVLRMEREGGQWCPRFFPGKRGHGRG